MVVGKRGGWEWYAGWTVVCYQDPKSAETHVLWERWEGKMSEELYNL